MALQNAGQDNREMLQALIDFCEESIRRFPAKTSFSARTAGGRWPGLTSTLA
jgi:hypothetical protein